MILVTEPHFCTTCCHKGVVRGMKCPDNNARLRITRHRDGERETSNFDAMSDDDVKSLIEYINSRSIKYETSFASYKTEGSGLM